MNVIDTNRMRNITLNYDCVPKSKRSDIKRLIYQEHGFDSKS